MLAVHLNEFSVRADPDRQPRPMITVVGAVRHRDGTGWNLMAATAVMALVRRF